jgi:hypothetical protein
MPLGWSRDLAGGSRRPAADARNPSIRSSVFEQVAQAAVSAVDGIVEVTHRLLQAQVWTRWETASDEKVCPVCGPYAGRVWRAGEGPQPPLHPHCRCQRAFAFTTWTVRE